MRRFIGRPRFGIHQGASLNQRGIVGSKATPVVNLNPTLSFAGFATGIGVTRSATGKSLGASAVRKILLLAWGASDSAQVAAPTMTATPNVGPAVNFTLGAYSGSISPAACVAYAVLDPASASATLVDVAITFNAGPIEQPMIGLWYEDYSKYSLSVASNAIRQGAVTSVQNVIAVPVAGSICVSALVDDAVTFNQSQSVMGNATAVQTIDITGAAQDQYSIASIRNLSAVSTTFKGTDTSASNMALASMVIH